MPLAYDRIPQEEMGSDTGPFKGDLDNITTDLAANGIINATAATFVTDGVIPGDFATVSQNIPANNGTFEIIEVNSETRITVDFVFTPVADPNDRVRVASGRVPAQLTVGFAFVGDDIIDVTGGTFLTNGTQIGSEARIVGTTNDDGPYRVIAVIDDDQIQCSNPDGSAVVFNGPSNGDVYVGSGFWKVIITDQVTVTWNILAFFKPGPGWVTETPLNRTSAGVAIKTLFEVDLQRIDIVRTGAFNTTWNSVNEVVVIRNRLDLTGGSPLAGNAGCLIRVPTGDPGNRAVVNIGTEGPDRLATENGSVWIGFLLESKSLLGDGASGDIEFNVFGSFVSNIDKSQTFRPGDGAKVINSVVDHIGIAFPDLGGTGGIIESSAIQAPKQFGIVVGGTGLDGQNVTLSKQTGIAAVIGAAVGTTLSGFIKSTDVPTPLITLFSTPDFVVLDPREDYTIAELFNVSLGSKGSVNYTWNPRFVERDEAGLSAAVVVVGAQVRVFSINETTQVETEETGSPFTTDAGGRISGGNGLELTRRSREFGGAEINFSHRVIMEDTRYRAVKEIIVLRSKLDVDFPIDVPETDFEGEFSR